MLNAAEALMAEAQMALEEEWRACHAPPPSLTVSEWAEQYRVLAGKAASEPGPWRTSRTPYLQKPMDVLSPRHPAKMVVIQKGSQVGFTEAANNWIGYLIDRAPGPILAVCPTEMLAHRWSKQRIQPLIDETPVLLGKVLPARKRDSGNTILLKEFPGGILAVAGANSAVSLRSIPAKYLVLDEVDAYPAQVGGEGDPVELAERATRTFKSSKKVLAISTPLVEGTSRIVPMLEECEQVWDYHVPCPVCALRQPLVWENMRWALPPGFELREDKRGRLREIPDVTYECAACHELIPEWQKGDMLARGDWVARWNHGEQSVGFYLPALYSPLGWFSWGEAAAMHERAQRIPEKRQVFVNTVIGQAYTVKVEAPEWELLFLRSAPYPRGQVQPGVLFLTAGVDVQSDRLEYEIVGWGREKRSWSVNYGVLVGDPSSHATWRQLDEVLAVDWPTAWGTTMPIACLAVDAGYLPLSTFDFCRRHLGVSTARQAIKVRAPRTVMAIVGRHQPRRVLSMPEKISAEERKRGLRIVTVGVSLLKKELYGFLRQPAISDQQRDQGFGDPHGYCRFPRYEESWFQGLVAERLQVRRDKRGFAEEVWTLPSGARNEPLDARNYARAAAAAVGIDTMQPWQWRKLEAAVQSPVVGSRPLPATQRRPEVAPPGSVPDGDRPDGPGAPSGAPAGSRRRRPFRVRMFQSPHMRR